MNIIEKSCEPFLLKKSDSVGILLIHGFSGSPGEMKPLGEYLADRGFTVNCILLPGHCTSPDDMNTKKWQDWANAVENGYKELQDMGIKNVFVCGLSMGGVLTLYLGEKYTDVSGLIPMAAPVEIKNWKLTFLPLLKHFKKFITKETAVKEAKEEYELKHFSYDVVPLSALHELLKLLKVVRKNLHKISAPTLIIHSRSDELVAPYNAELIYNNISSADKRIFWLEKSHHVVTLDKERHILYQEIEKFINEHISNQ
ncbi:MAG: alpha/beta fold hydrolase [Candidatus Asgardarchaeum sp.]